MSAIRPVVRTALLAALTCTSLAAPSWAGNGDQATVYKWVDAHGIIHYSDQPHPNAKKLTVAGAQTFSAPTPAEVTASPEEPARPAPARAYESCAITQPGDQQMLMNVYRTTAVVQTEPALRPGNTVNLYLDGRRLPGSGPSFTFPVYRGQHSLSAVVVDSVGQIVCETSTVTFFVHQPSIKNPHNPVHPH